MAERVEVDVIVEAIAKGFAKVQADLKKTGTTADTAGKKAGKGFDAFDKSLKNIVTGGALGFIGAQLVQFGKDSIQAASDVEEMQSKFNTVFGELAGEVTGELQTFADAANRSIFDLQGFAASLQDTFVPMGFARDEAAKMSIQVVKLAEDLASFNNIPTEEALERLQGGLIGNHENLIKFGVRINEAVLKEQLLIDGTNELTGAALEQAKAQARMTLIMKGTTDA